MIILQGAIPTVWDRSLLHLVLVQGLRAMVVRTMPQVLGFLSIPGCTFCQAASW